MTDARVIGSIRATIKHESFRGLPLWLVQPVGVGGRPDGPPLVALDRCGCRRGDRVILTSEAGAVADITGRGDSPARWSILGIVDP